MNQSFILQMRPHFGLEEKNAICQYMDEDGFLTEFKRTLEFEKLISDYTGAKHCIVVNNGTISLTLAAMASGIKPGDEVIVPNYTMIATPNSISMLGATPVFVDVEIDTLCLDYEKTKAAITNKTRAIILVSANGRYPSVGISAFEILAKQHNLILIEDAAQALGSFYPDSRHVGTAGLIGSISFSAPKIISTGQGGAVITNDDEIASKIRKLKDFGRTGGGNDIHESIGYNFKFTELQACIGIEQMKKLESRVIQKKKIWNQYFEELRNLSDIKIFEHNLEFTCPWFIDIIANDRSKLIEFLHSKGIGTRPMYPPINKQAAYNIPGDHLTSNFIGMNGLWLPSSIQLSSSEISYICNSIKIFYKELDK